MKKSGKAYYMISAVAQKYNIHPQTLRLYEREGLLKPSRTDGNTRLYSEEDLEQLETILTLTRDLGVNLAGVEVILNMRRKIQQMQGEVNEFMEYVKRELARGIDDWEQRLSTAMVKSTSTDLVRVNPPSAHRPPRQKNTRDKKTSRYHVACFRRRKTNPSVPSAMVPVGNPSRKATSSASRAATAGAMTSTSASIADARIPRRYHHCTLERFRHLRQRHARRCAEPVAQDGRAVSRASSAGCFSSATLALERRISPSRS